MRLWTCVLLAAGCSSSNGPNVPVNGGGGGDAGPDSSFTAIDARADAPGGSTVDASTVLHGRVCLAADPRKLLPAVDAAACATTGADGLTVALKGQAQTATTNPDGTFTIGGPGDTNGLLWKVSGSNIVTSYMLVGDFEIPAISTATYAALRASNNIADSAGEAAVFVIAVQNGHGLSGGTSVSAPLSDYRAFYDGGSATGAWPQTATGPFGTSWLQNIDVGASTASVTVTSIVGTTTTTVTSAPQPLFDHAITFTSVVFP